MPFIFYYVIVCILLSSIVGVVGSLFLKTLIDDYITPLLGVTNPDYTGLLTAILTMALTVLYTFIGLKLFGADCFGLLPCAGVVFIGMFIGKTLYKNKKSLMPKLDGTWKKPFVFVGNNALLIYLLHQVVSVAIIVLLYLIAGYRL